MTDDQLDNDLAEENNPSNEQVDEQPVEETSAAADDQTAEDYRVETPGDNSDESDESDEPTAPEAEASVSDDSVETTDDASSESAEDEASTESHEQPQ